MIKFKFTHAIICLFLKSSIPLNGTLWDICAVRGVCSEKNINPNWGKITYSLPCRTFYWINQFFSICFFFPLVFLSLQYKKMNIIRKDTHSYNSEKSSFKNQSISPPEKPDGFVFFLNCLCTRIKIFENNFNCQSI